MKIPDAEASKFTNCACFGIFPLYFSRAGLGRAVRRPQFVKVREESGRRGVKIHEMCMFRYFSPLFFTSRPGSGGSETAIREGS